jgi:hypothetical protein
MKFILYIIHIVATLNTQLNSLGMCSKRLKRMTRLHMVINVLRLDLLIYSDMFTFQTQSEVRKVICGGHWHFEKKNIHVVVINIIR